MCARLTSHAERYDVIILDLASWRGQISCPVVQELRLPSRVCYFPQILHGKTSSSIACYWGCKYQVCWSVRAEEIIIYLSGNLMEINCFSNSNLTFSHLRTLSEPSLISNNLTTQWHRSVATGRCDCQTVWLILISVTCLTGPQHCSLSITAPRRSEHTLIQNSWCMNWTAFGL